MNKVILVGHIGRDAETKFTSGGKNVTKFSLATKETFGTGDQRKEETEWHNITLWNREGLSQYLTKGKEVAVSGKIHTDSYDKDGVKVYRTEIIADTVELIGGKGSNGGDSRSSDTRGGDERSSGNSRGSNGNSRPAPTNTRQAAPQQVEEPDLPF